MAKYYLYTSYDYEGSDLDFTPYDTLEDAQKAGEQSGNGDHMSIIECSNDVLKFVKVRGAEWSEGEYVYRWNDYIIAPPLTPDAKAAIQDMLISITRDHGYGMYVYGDAITNPRAGWASASDIMKGE